MNHLPTDNQINKKQEEAELNRKSLVSVTETIYAHTRACVIVCVCMCVYICICGRQGMPLRAHKYFG
jgi:L-cysteine desulfidase